MLGAFAPIVMFLCGVANVVVPAKVLITSVVVFIVIPLAAGWITRTALLRSHGKQWFEQIFLPKFHPVTIGSLLLRLVLIFAFQAENLTSGWIAVLLIAVWIRKLAGSPGPLSIPVSKGSTENVGADLRNGRRDERAPMGWDHVPPRIHGSSWNRELHGDVRGISGQYRNRGTHRWRQHRAIHVELDFGARRWAHVRRAAVESNGEELLN